MPHYRYRARDLHGSSVSGVMEASDTKDLEKKLSERRVYLIEAKEERAGLLSKQISIPFLRKVRPTHLILFTRQLSAMLKAGVPITQALGTLSEQTESFTLKEAIKKIREDIERGSNFADALARHPTIFSELYVSTVRVGEETGNIEEVLDSISNFLEREMDVKSKVKGALLYPIVLLVVASGLIVFLVSYVLPKFRAVFY
ncbi:type II secretion system F family protein, partial [Candidatus Calescamantes bacterium]|nr:type II secretion system F family protein [Candidatus Calescamantes bacterium]